MTEYREQGQSKETNRENEQKRNWCNYRRVWHKKVEEMFKDILKINCLYVGKKIINENTKT